MCMRVTALSRIYYIAVHLVNKVIYLPVKPAEIAGHSKFHTVTQTIYRFPLFEKIYLRNVAKAGARTHNLQRCSQVR